MAWLTNYKERKKITIAGTPDGAQNKYQVKLNVLSDNPADTYAGIANSYPLQELSSSPILVNGDVNLPAGCENLADEYIIVDKDNPNQLIMYFTAWDANNTSYICRATASISNPYSWTLYSVNKAIVLQKGSAGSWEEMGVRMGSVIVHNGIYYLYYTGYTNSYATWRMGLAKSSDGINFTKDNSNPIFNVDGIHPNIVVDGTTWYLYDDIYSIPSSYRVRSSNNYGVTWSALTTVKSASFDPIDHPIMERFHVSKVGTNFVMVYEAYKSDPTVPVRIGLAYSATYNGTFINYGSAYLQESGIIGKYDRYHVATPFLYRDASRNKWLLFHQGSASVVFDGNPWSIGIAESSISLEGHARSDFADIRFTKADGTTLLPYWNESKSDGNNAVVWIEFDSIPASPSSAYFYLYYNNTSASSVSDGDNTFIFFDDFPGTSLDMEKWSGDTSKASVSGSICTVTNTVAGEGKISTAIFSGGLALRGSVKFALIQYSQLFIHEAWPADSNYLVWYYDGISPWSQLTNKAGSFAVVSTTAGSGTVYNIYDLCRGLSPDVSRFYKDGVKVGSDDATHVPITGLNITLRPYKGGAGNPSIYADWVLLRKYTANEPTWQAWGSEETSPAIIHKGSVLLSKRIFKTVN